MNELSTLKPKNPCSLAERSLIDGPTAGSLEALFKVLANENRLRLLHALERAGELPVSELADGVGMSVQSVSNQLQRLVDQRVLTSRRDGNHVWYRIIDPCVTGLLDLGLCLIEENRAR
ncbi:MAG: ArsR/SmtB family transcription factor [Microthrixaceae bacterium]